MLKWSVERAGVLCCQFANQIIIDEDTNTFREVPIDNNAVDPFYNTKYYIMVKDDTLSITVTIYNVHNGVEKHTVTDKKKLKKVLIDFKLTVEYLLFSHLQSHRQSLLNNTRQKQIIKYGILDGVIRGLSDIRIGELTCTPHSLRNHMYMKPVNLYVEPTINWSATLIPKITHVEGITMCNISRFTVLFKAGPTEWSIEVPFSDVYELQAIIETTFNKDLFTLVTSHIADYAIKITNLSLKD